MGIKDVDREKAAEASKKAIKRRSEAVNARGRATDRRQDGEVRSRKDSITSFCSECITSYGDDVGGHGSIKNAIRHCPATECHLWPWRLGTLDLDGLTTPLAACDEAS